MNCRFCVATTVWMFLLVWAQPGMCGLRVGTEQGEYQLDVEFGANPVRVGMNVVTLRLRDMGSKEPVGESMKIEIVPWMPMHEHTVMEMPRIQAMGAGEFRVEDLHFTMPGDWEVHLRMDSGGREDSAVFDVKVEP